jgi:hypothetical protein
MKKYILRVYKGSVDGYEIGRAIYLGTGAQVTVKPYDDDTGVRNSSAPDRRQAKRRQDDKTKARLKR